MARPKGKSIGSWSFNPNRTLMQTLNGALEKGLVLGAEHVLGESNKRVPHEEGILEDAGSVSYESGKLRAAISYNTPYAAVQHEDMSLRHDNGREAKYLENALNAEKDTVGEIIAKATRGEL
ncbi:hypothetical protein [Glutamicibacter sp. NPDC127525]|uniref:hypothetical protein n=1 Tax=unclassified Glutamicibacter TaxID=2627139 RepID=UPI003644CF50